MKYEHPKTNNSIFYSYILLALNINKKVQEYKKWYKKKKKKKEEGKEGKCLLVALYLYNRSTY